jgi:hypothetical protein
MRVLLRLSGQSPGVSATRPLALCDEGGIPCSPESALHLRVMLLGGRFVLGATSNLRARLMQETHEQRVAFVAVLREQIIEQRRGALVMTESGFSECQLSLRFQEVRD